MRWEKKTTKQRFYEKVGIDWMWKGTKDTHGYGQMVVNGVTILAHRLSYQIHNGEIPVGMHVLHSCDIPCCMNPEHLHLGTNYDNVKERVERGRSGACHGELHGRAKLNRRQVEEIRIKYAKGVTQTQLGKMYGISQSSIGKIVNFLHWKE